MTLHWLSLRLKSDENEASKAIALAFCLKRLKLKLVEFDCRLKSDDNEAILAKSKAIALVLCLKML